MQQLITLFVALFILLTYSVPVAVLAKSTANSGATAATQLVATAGKTDPKTTSKVQHWTTCGV